MKSELSELNRDRARSVALILAMVTVLVYLPACFHDFISLDDPAYVSENERVQAGLTWAGLKWAFTTFSSSNWHPLTWISHMLDCQLFGLNAGAHHCINVLFHTANTVLLFLFLIRTTRALWTCAFVAALFAWHPVHVESVAWIAERKDVLSTFLGLLALLAYARYVSKVQNPKFRVPGPKSEANPSLDTGRRTLDYVLALLFFGLGLMAKPMLVTFPFVLLLLDYWPLNRMSGVRDEVSSVRFQVSGGETSEAKISAANIPHSTHNSPLTTHNSGVPTLWRLIVEKWPFFLLTVASCIVTFLAQREIAVVPVNTYPAGLRLSNAVVSCVRYLKNAVWPSDLALIYPLPKQWPLWQVLAAAALLAAVSVVVWRARRRAPYCLTGWLWFLGMLVPVIGLVQVGPQAMADRYTYVPLVGVFVALGWGVKSLAARWPLSAVPLSIASGLALGGCILGTERQLHYWRDTESLLKRTLAVTQNNPFAHMVLSTSLAQQRRWDDASVEFGKAVRLEESPFAETSVEREYRVRTHLLLAQVLEMRGHPDEALTYYQDALRLNPASVEAHNNLGNLLQKLGRREDAMAQYREALRAGPDAPLAHVNLGTLLIEIGRVEEGMGEYAEAARLKSEDPLPHYLAAKVWLRHGQSAKAIGEFHEALRRNPDDFQVSTYAARVLAADLDPDVRNGREAAGLAQKANALSGGTQPLVLDTLAMAYAEAGRFEEAQQTMRKAIELAQAVGAQNWIQDMKQRLQLYESGRPYRTASTNLLSTPGVGDRPTRDQSTPSAPGSDSTP